MKKIGAMLTAVVTAFSGVGPVQAMPALKIQVPDLSAQGVDLVHHKPGHSGGPPHARTYSRYNGTRYSTGTRYGYHNGYRGYRYSRNGYHQHSDGWWYPLAAFGTGLIIGGSIASPRRPAYSNSASAHVDWCYSRYRSYSAYDNSFQPYNGPRQQCISPYY